MEKHIKILYLEGNNSTRDTSQFKGENEERKAAEVKTNVLRMLDGALIVNTVYIYILQVI